jgi:DNA-binding PadR family transcriptional regulator
MAKLTPTSYAVLGLLARKPWSAYELTAYIRKSALNVVWPRAVSKLYEEPKKLVDYGFAKVRSEQVGGRKRKVYSITPPGRKALRAWLSEPSGPFAFESEAMLKVAHTDHTTKENLLARIREIREQALEARAEQAVPIASEYGTGGGNYPERVHLITLTFQFGLELSEALIRWADWAEANVNEWSSLQLDPETDRRARAFFQDALTGVSPTG